LKRPAVAIDGPAGSGKSTVARRVAELLGYTYIDTGAMYRAAALAARRKGVAPDDEEGLRTLMKGLDIGLATGENGLRVALDGEDVSEPIRTRQAGMDASTYSRSPAVRERLAQLQRKMAEEGGVVMEGRDIGTVVLPDAEVKIFLDAKPEERARRRIKDFERSGEKADFLAVLEEVVKRDKQDTERELSPLKPAPDALKIDTTDLSIEQVADKVIKAVNGHNPHRGE